MPPPFPTGWFHAAPGVSFDSLRGRVVPSLVSLSAGGVRAEHHGPGRNGSVSSAGPPDRSHAAASYRSQPGSFPYVDATPQHNPHRIGATLFFCCIAFAWPPETQTGEDLKATWRQFDVDYAVEWRPHME